MARVTVPIDPALLESTQAAEAYVSYGGPLPPLDVYRMRISRVKYKTNKNGDWYYEVTGVINHDDNEPKSKFNGWMRSTNLTFSDQGMKFVKQFGEAAGFNTKELLHPLLDDADDETVLKIGAKPATGYMLRVSLKQGKPYNGKKTNDLGSFFPDAPDAGKAMFVRDEPETDDEFDAGGDDDAFDTSGTDSFEGDGDGFDDDAEATATGDDFDDSGVDEFADEAQATPPPAKATAKKAPAKAAASRTGTPY